MNPLVLSRFFAFCLSILAMVATLRAQPVDLSPVMRWSFDRLENGAFPGASSAARSAAVEGRVEVEAGRAGGSASFAEEPSGQVLVPVDLTALSRDGSFTVAFWACPGGRAAQYGTCLDAGANKGFVIRTNNRGALSLSAGGVWNVVADSAPLPEGAWTHVALVHRAGQLRLFAGGRLVGTAPLAAPTAIPAVLRMGSVTERMKQPDGALVESRVKGFVGALDELQIHARALSDEEVSRLAR